MTRVSTPTFCFMLARDRLLKTKKTLSWVGSGGTSTSLSVCCPAINVSMLVAVAMDGYGKQTDSVNTEHSVASTLVERAVQCEH